MGHPDEKVKSPEKETGSGSTNRLYMYHQRRGNFARDEEENPSDTETSKREGNHPSEIRGLCLMKLSCEMLQNLSKKISFFGVARKPKYFVFIFPSGQH